MLRLIIIKLLTSIITIEILLANKTIIIFILTTICRNVNSTSNK